MSLILFHFIVLLYHSLLSRFIPREVISESDRTKYSRLDQANFVEDKILHSTPLNTYSTLQYLVSDDVLNIVLEDPDILKDFNPSCIML